MNDDEQMWWDVIPIGAVLDHKNVWEGTAEFTADDKRYKVDLWDDTVTVE